MLSKFDNLLKYSFNRIKYFDQFEPELVFFDRDLIFFDIKATGFLYGMVRAIVGQLVLVGEKKITPEIFIERWKKKKKDEVLESAPAKGLCFVNAKYSNNIFQQVNNKDLFPKFLICD